MRKPVTELSSKQIYSSSVTPELMYYSTTAFTGFPTRFLLHLKRWRAKILARKGLQNFRAIRTEEINYYTPLHLHCDPVIDIQTGKFENERRSIMIIFILKKQTYFPGQIEAHGHFNHSLGPHHLLYGLLQQQHPAWFPSIYSYPVAVHSHMAAKMIF